MYNSILNKIWSEYEVPNHLVQEIKDAYSLDYLLAKILSTKNLQTELIDNFLKPQIKTAFPKWDFFLDMAKGVKRAMKAIYNNEKICIFGDYDVDGSAGAALLYKGFKHLGIEPKVYIPDRISEGYGLNIKSLDCIRQNGASLLITIDCGTSALEEIDYANSIGLDVIVIDHHISDILPKAIAVINPNRMDQPDGYNYLCGTGVGFIFLANLIRDLKSSNFFSNKSIPNLLEWLDLVALGTIADVMQLQGLNRVFVKRGLEVLKDTKNIGLKALIKISSAKSTVYGIGFQIGPRINAGGRIGESNLGFKLLTSEDQAEADQYARRLDLYNIERQKMEVSILAEAINLVDASQNIIFIGGIWHQGLIGIIASRIKDRYEKPVIIFSMTEDGIYKASGRSTSGFDLGVIVTNSKLEGLVINGGGHKMAIGFSFQKENLELLKNFFSAGISKQKQIISKNNYFELSASRVNLVTMELLAKLEPFGPGNRDPLFLIKNVVMKKIKLINEKFISLEIESKEVNNFSEQITFCKTTSRSNKNIFKGVIFNQNLVQASQKQNLQTIIHIVCSLQLDHFSHNGIQLNIQDIIVA